MPPIRPGDRPRRERSAAAATHRRLRAAAGQWPRAGAPAPRSPGTPRIAVPRRLPAASARRAIERVATTSRQRMRDADPECAAGAEAPLASPECCSIASRPPASRSRLAYPAAGVKRTAPNWCPASPGERFAAPELVLPAGALVPWPARSPAPDRAGRANRRPGLGRARRAQEQIRPMRGSPSEPLRCSPPSGTLPLTRLPLRPRCDG
jgi:hypothetical protein